MTRLLLVRHAHPVAGWDGDHDPGLDAKGRAQAAALAAALTPRGPLPVVVSPLRRTRETAAPLARSWHDEALIEPRVGELPSPTDDLRARTEWLRGTLRCRWPELGAELAQWRATLLDTLVALRRDTVVVTHYVAINAAVGAATGDDRAVSFSPDHCSITELDVQDGLLRLVTRGDEAITSVQ